MVIVKLSVVVVDGFVKFSKVNDTAVVTFVVELNPFLTVMVLVLVVTVHSKVVPDGIPVTPVHTGVVLGVMLAGYFKTIIALVGIAFVGVNVNV